MSMCMPKWELVHLSILLEQDNEKAKTPTTSNAGDTRACQAKTRHHKDRHAVIEDTLEHGSQASRTPECIYGREMALLAPGLSGNRKLATSLPPSSTNHGRIWHSVSSPVGPSNTFSRRRPCSIKLSHFGRMSPPGGTRPTCVFIATERNASGTKVMSPSVARPLQDHPAQDATRNLNIQHPLAFVLSG
jgi:hypothetical protein